MGRVPSRHGPLSKAGTERNALVPEGRSLRTVSFIGRHVTGGPAGMFASSSISVLRCGSRTESPGPVRSRRLSLLIIRRTPCSIFTCSLAFMYSLLVFSVTCCAGLFSLGPVIEHINIHRISIVSNIKSTYRLAVHPSHSSTPHAPSQTQGLLRQDRPDERVVVDLTVPTR